MKSEQTINHFIHGEFYSSEAKFNKLNPFNSEPIYTVASASAIDLVKAISFGQKAFADWKEVSLSERLNWLLKIKDEYINSKNEIIRSESLDQGLSVTFTESANYEVGLKIIDDLILEIKTQISSVAANRLYSPVGLMAVILSWNLSNRLFIERTLPALMAGNAVITKFSSMAPATAFLWANIFKKIGFPAGVIQFIHAQDQGLKDLLITHPGIKAISFAGTLKNASDILKKTAALSHNQFKKIQLTAGAKNPAIVTTEPDEKLAIEVLNSFLIGQGQLAWNSSRLFILEKHATFWNEIFAKYLNQLIPMEGIDHDSVWSPILKKSSFSHFAQIQKQAIEDQAKLIFSNKIQKLPENYLYPTFTKDMSNCSTLQQDQVLAPLYIVSEVKYPFDISKYANVSYYGFGASVWGDPLKTAKICEQLDVGQVCLNRWLVYSNESIQAVKQSAFGVQDRRIFGDFFSNVKNLS